MFTDIITPVYLIRPTADSKKPWAVCEINEALTISAHETRNEAKEALEKLKLSPSQGG